MAECCLRSPFAWDGTPRGEITTLGPHNNKTYVTGKAESNVAIMVIHDLLSWEWKNIRLLADHYANEVGARVWVPDFFGGETLPSEVLRDNDRRREVDVPGFLRRNTKTIREPEIFACASAIRALGYSRLGAIGFCFGGWAVFRLGANSSKHPDPYPHKPLVDCISTAHPTWLMKEEMDVVSVPVQILAPEIDPMFTPELKTYANGVIPTLGVPYDYQYFPGVEHAFGTRGLSGDGGKEMRALERGKRAMVAWMREWLCVEEEAEK